MNGDIEFINPPREGKLESTNLPGNVRKQVQEAIQALGGRVTVGDVAARAGVRVSEAESALNALAADCNASIQVSDAGDALYAFPSDFVSIIKNRSLWLELAPLIAKFNQTAGWLARVSFGAALVASVALVWITIVALLTASSQDNNRDNRRGGGYNQGYYSRGPSPMIWFNSSDLLWFQSPRTPRHKSKAPMSFLESVFSFVFGDGDPNRSFEEKRWQMVGRFIQSRGGVVTAEELAPFLDPPAKVEGDDTIDEGFVVPALVRFGGTPEVDEQGNLLYRFESLQRSGGTRLSSPEEPVALQNLWEQTKATGGQKAGAIALGAVNVLGLTILAALPGGLSSLAGTSLSFMIALVPLLAVYAVSFFAIPAVRMVLNIQRNAKLEAANQNRLERLREVRNPEPALQRKLASAQRQAKRIVIRDTDIIYRTDRDLMDQNKDLSQEDFDRRLNSSGSRRYDEWAPAKQAVDADNEWRR